MESTQPQEKLFKFEKKEKRIRDENKPKKTTEERKQEREVRKIEREARRALKNENGEENGNKRSKSTNAPKVNRNQKLIEAFMESIGCDAEQISKGFEQFNQFKKEQHAKNKEALKAEKKELKDKIQKTQILTKRAVIVEMPREEIEVVAGQQITIPVEVRNEVQWPWYKGQNGIFLNTESENENLPCDKVNM